MIDSFRTNHHAATPPRLSDVRARLTALERADARARVETATMTIVHAQSILDLTERPTARGLDFRPGASVWYREDIRLADGAARVVPAVFIAYRHQRGQCGIVRALTDDGHTRPTWVAARRRLPPALGRRRLRHRAAPGVGAAGRRGAARLRADAGPGRDLDRRRSSGSSRSRCGGCVISASCTRRARSRASTQNGIAANVTEPSCGRAPSAEAMVAACPLPRFPATS